MGFEYLENNEIVIDNMERTCFGQLGDYKGSNGKVGVIGGCFEYTGAPYYAAVSALRSGSDLAHIFCTKSAGLPIKTYSPEIIVHPTLAASNEDSISDFSGYSDQILEQTTKWYPALHCLIIGPGLGRDDFLANYLAPKLLTAAISQSNR
jgi:ATP-dependent NAD(P)H-hydrate dehydratase